MPWTSKRRLEPPPMAATLSFLDLVRGLLGAVLHVLRGIADLVAGSLFTAVLDGADSLIDLLAGTFHGPFLLAGREQERRGAQGGGNDDFVHECSKSNCEVCGRRESQHARPPTAPFQVDAASAAAMSLGVPSL